MAPLSAKHAGTGKQSAGAKRMCWTSSRRSSLNSMDLHRSELINTCNKIRDSKFSRLSRPIEPDKPETVTILGNSNIRDLIIPSRKARIYPTVIPTGELNRLKKASKIVSLERKVEELERLEVEKKKIEEEAEKRKKLLKKIDERRESAKPRIQQKSIEEENQVKILDRAFLAKQEQEEEVKRANRIILAAKCHVIRDAQIAEKNELARELREEELRLEKMMEEERTKALKAEDKRLEELKELNTKHALDIKDQLKRRELRREMEADRVEEEAKCIAKAKFAIQRDEEFKARLKRERTAKIRADLQKVAELSSLMKKIEFEQQRQAEMKVQEYMKTKEERDKKLVLERKLAKETLERKQERMVTLQQKKIQTKEEQIDMAIRREREEKEREFRKRERDAALRRKQIEKELIEARQRQIEEVKHRRALQIAREEDDFKQSCAKLKEEEAREKELERLRTTNREKYREEILKQMNVRELHRQEMQRKARNDFLAHIAEEQNREKNVHSVIQAKIAAMRRAKMPEKFIRDVEKQLVSTVSN